MPESSAAPQRPEHEPVEAKHPEGIAPFDIDAWFAYRDEHPIPPEEWEAYQKALASLRKAAP